MSGPTDTPPHPDLGLDSYASSKLIERNLVCAAIKPAEVDKYEASWAIFAEDAMANTQGINAIVSTMKQGESNKVVQLYYYDNIGDFFGQNRDGIRRTWINEIHATYASTPEAKDVCTIFGTHVGSFGDYRGRASKAFGSQVDVDYVFTRPEAQLP